MCIYIYNIYIEQMPDCLNNNGRILCRFLQFFFGNFCHWFSNNWNNPVKFCMLAAALFLGVVRSTRNIFACQCPHQRVKPVWPQLSLAGSVLLISVTALQEVASNRYPREQTISPILAQTNEVCAATAACYVLGGCHGETDDHKRQNSSHGDKARARSPSLCRTVLKQTDLLEEYFTLLQSR